MSRSPLVNGFVSDNPGRDVQRVGTARLLGQDPAKIHEPVWGVVGNLGDSQCYLGVTNKVQAIHSAIAERISQPRMLQFLADLGARDGFLLDGGGSSAMGIGKGSTGIPASVLLGGGRPVATYIGVRALPCASTVSTGCD